ncbi:TetR family transcriptional regulator [Nocardioides convexus]|uniref:TetR/AcrR family transcriptional regulator n=1 Tax=Nocardioides convexus TaxID=2712224 RepID=UPI002418564B|nr:TetR family transcriptional regulator [Nocardioides convexus]
MSRSWPPRPTCSPHAASTASPSPSLGAACGISGPALYKHFPSKHAMLAEMLTSISERLLAVGRERVDAAAGDPAAALRGLVEWHVEFALGHRPLIVVQDRDWESLPEDARAQVRRLQRSYIALWADQAPRPAPRAWTSPAPTPPPRRPSACSTPPRAPATAYRTRDCGSLLGSMALAALGVSAPGS